MSARAVVGETAKQPEASRPSVLLASESRTRVALLRHAGITCTAERSGIDEDEIKRALRRERVKAVEAAETLAEFKAVKVSRRHAGALVIGADQILECEGEWLGKPGDLDRARAQLSALRGKSNELVTAVVVARDGARIWHHVARARLEMRVFSDAFLDLYLESVGRAACDSVGAYQLEGLGVQLFSRVEGDYFAILGLPLLPLLDFLRNHGVIPA